MIPVVFVGGLAAATLPAADYPILHEGQCTPDDPHFDLEVLYHEGSFEEGSRIARERLVDAPDDPVLHWMAARFLYELGELLGPQTPRNQKEAHYQEMVALADAGLALAPGDPHLRFVRGVGMGRLGTTRGVLSSLFMADDIEEDWLSVSEHPTFRYSSIGAEEVLPCDATFALGIFYRLVPDWWIVQLLAGTRGSLDKSVTFHQRAVVCKPDAIQNWKELGATQLCIGTSRDDAAALAAGHAALQQALALPAQTDKERIDHDHVRMLQGNPESGCEYSRDGQQDLDRKKLE